MTDFEFNSGNVYRIKKEHMENIFKAYNVKNIDALREKIENGYIPDITVLDVDYEIKLEKLKHLKVKSEIIKKYQDLKTRKLDAETRISEYHADSLDIIGSTPSKQAKKAMGHYVNQTKHVDENSIRCPDCNVFQTNSRHPIEWQVDAITKHIQNFHKRDFTESEADEIAEMIK